jgi:hypothetical protein
VKDCVAVPTRSVIERMLPAAVRTAVRSIVARRVGPRKRWARVVLPGKVSGFTSRGEDQ